MSTVPYSRPLVQLLVKALVAGVPERDAVLTYTGRVSFVQTLLQQENTHPCPL